MIARRFAPVLITTLAGCGSVPAVVDGYDGPAREDDALAVLFTPAATSLPATRDPARLAAIDDRVYGDSMHGYPWVVRTLPGSVVLKVVCRASALPDYKARLIHVAIEAGHYYALVCHDLRSEATDCGADYGAVKPLLPAEVAGRLPDHTSSRGENR